MPVSQRSASPPSFDPAPGGDIDAAPPIGRAQDHERHATASSALASHPFGGAVSKSAPATAPRCRLLLCRALPLRLARVRYATPPAPAPTVPPTPPPCAKYR